MPDLFDNPLLLARVAVERGIDRFPDGLTYSVPAALAGLRPGERVLVPLGRGDAKTAGYVIDLVSPDDDATPRDRLKAIHGRDQGGIALPPPLVELARWVAAYYACPIGLAIAGALPAAVKRQVGAVTRVFVDLAPVDGGGEAGDESASDIQSETPAASQAESQGESQGGSQAGSEARPDPHAHRALARPRGRPLSPKQRAVLEHLRRTPPGERPMDVRAVVQACGLASPAPITSLIAKGMLVATRRTTVEAEWAAQSIEPPTVPTPTAEQAQAILEIGETLGRGFSSHLLFGVTGSGKTEVYLRLIERTLAMGRTALMLVPEIALTPQTGGRIVARLPRHRVAILHSGLTAAQRHQQWALVADGRADVVLGARSAVFAPLPPGRLGLVVVDEEHDPSYKQDQAPRYHGRDVAMRRAQLEGVPIVLGSATPSLESWHNAVVRGSFRLHRLPRRAPGLSTPVVTIVDFRDEQRARAAAPSDWSAPRGAGMDDDPRARPLPRDTRVRLLGPTLEGAVGRALRDGGQAILLLNRRGFGNYVACPDRQCGWTFQCDDCDATMVCHTQLDRLARLRAGDPHAGMYVRCHHCEAEQRLPARCPRCGNRVTVFGLGTQRVEEEIERTFGLRTGETLLRVDGDSMRRAADLHDALRRFGRGDVRVLLGTQMIAKGLDFPNVRVVGVISADTALALPDFRSSERTFQLVAQVAGRCGRGDHAGVAIVQTFEPSFEPIVRAAANDYEGFAARELEDRRRWSLPPSTRMVRIVVRDRDFDRCVDAARGLADTLRALAVDAGADDEARATVHGPAPCPIARIAGRHRQQVELVAPRAGAIQRLLALARGAGAIRPGEQMAVDVDPVSMA